MVNIVSNRTDRANRGECRRFQHPEPAVLIVDDDPNVTDVLQEFLEDEGFTVFCEENGCKALESIEQNRPDLVLADMRMPVMDGITLLREISVRWTDVDVIMMSATESPAGLPVPFIQKPFDLDDVISTICDSNSSS